MKIILKRIFRLNYIFYFSLSSILFLYFPYKYEQRVLEAYVKYVKEDSESIKEDKEKMALHIMQKLHDNMVESGAKSVDLNLSWIENLFTSPIMQYALSKDGACGGFTLVLGQVLQSFGYQIRPIQMKVAGKYGGHIVLEVNVNNKWIVLDPLYNQSFRNPQGQLATFDEVKTNWAQYQKQTDSTYNFTYKYEGKRYTNWERLPVLGKVVKKTIAVCSSNENAENFSFRSHFLNPRTTMFRFAKNMTLFLFLWIIYRKVGKPFISKWRNKKTELTN